jgi:hypothetical protein
MPVCGQLPNTTQTFANRCVMTNAGAVLLSEGVCKPQPLTKDVTLKVAHQLIDCMGMVPMRCMRVKMDDQENWSAHYDLVHKDKCAPERITVGESRILKLLAGGEPCN